MLKKRLKVITFPNVLRKSSLMITFAKCPTSHFQAYFSTITSDGQQYLACYSDRVILNLNYFLANHTSAFRVTANVTAAEFNVSRVIYTVKTGFYVNWRAGPKHLSTGLIPCIHIYPYIYIWFNRPCVCIELYMFQVK